MDIKKYPDRFTMTIWILMMNAVLIYDVHGWPEGTFGLPMPKTGCPTGSAIEWETGSRTHITESGSHTSESIHLAGIEPNPTDHVVQIFCMKMSYPKEGDYQWMPGKYCIFKKGDCPARFQQGYILWDDAASYFKSDSRQSSKGVLPDGEYGHNTKIFYCCRTDGASHTPIQTPSNAPFYLLKFGDACQEVEDMEATEEWVYWADETSANINDQGGVYPRVIRSGRVKVYTKLFYCYYRQKPPSSTRQVVMLVIYVAAGVIGAITILSFSICAIKAICHHYHRKKSSPEHHSGGRVGGVNEDIGGGASRLITQSSEPPTVYRYVSVRTSDDGDMMTIGGPVVIPSAPPLVEEGVRIPPASPDEGNQKVELREPNATGKQLCARAPSCVCQRCISIPPSYDEVISTGDGVDKKL